MIKFSLFGIEGKVNEGFELEIKHSELKNILLKDLLLFSSNFKPQEGDIFLSYAEHLKSFGAKILKAEQQKNSEGVIF